MDDKDAFGSYASATIEEETLTLLDCWPLFAVIAMAIFAIFVVARGLRRPGDSSKNKSGGGGANFIGRGGRW